MSLIGGMERTLWLEGEVVRLEAEIQRLQRALNFWLPMVPEDAPLDENDCLSRG